MFNVHTVNATVNVCTGLYVCVCVIKHNVAAGVRLWVCWRSGAHFFR